MSNHILTFLWMVGAPAVMFVLLSGYVYGLDTYVVDDIILSKKDAERVRNWFNKIK